MDRIRLADTLAALSLAGDLGHGQTLEHSLRATLLALLLADRLRLGAGERREAFYVGLLQATGCVGNAHDTAALLQTDDLAFKHAIVRANFQGPAAQLRTVVRLAGSGGSGMLRPVAIAAALSRPDAPSAMARQHCEIAALIARRAGLGDGVEHGLRALFERWDGGGAPDGRRGADIPLATRLVQVGVAVDVASIDGGGDAAAAFVGAAAGKVLDPELAAACLDLLRATPPWDALAAPSLWDDVLAREPAAAQVLSAEDLDGVALTFADFADLKSPWFIGHSRGVASLAEAAARALHLSGEECASIRRAALLHDVGRATVSNRILDKPARLTPGEQERVRLHAYYTERVLARSAAFAPYAAVASAHHERLDGSGYPRRVGLAALSIGARIVAGADVLQALTEDRPHRLATRPRRHVPPGGGQRRPARHGGRPGARRLIRCVARHAPPGVERPLRPGTGGRPAARGRALEQGDRVGARDQPEHRAAPPRERVRKARRDHADRCGDGGPRTGPALGRRRSSEAGWGGRNRTFGRGFKVPCLTTWPRPSAESVGGHCAGARLSDRPAAPPTAPQ